MCKDELRDFDRCRLLGRHQREVEVSCLTLEMTELAVTAFGLEVLDASFPPSLFEPPTSLDAVRPLRIEPVVSRAEGRLWNAFIARGTDQNPAIHLYTCERGCPEARSARDGGVQ